MRKLVVVLTSVVMGAVGVSLHAQDQHAHRHYLLRAAADDIDAIASRHGLLIERRDEGPPAMYIAGSDQEPTALKADIAQDVTVLAFEDEQTISLPETSRNPGRGTLPDATPPPPEAPAPSVPPPADPPPVVVPEAPPSPAPSAPAPEPPAFAPPAPEVPPPAVPEAPPTVAPEAPPAPTSAPETPPAPPAEPQTPPAPAPAPATPPATEPSAPPAAPETPSAPPSAPETPAAPPVVEPVAPAPPSAPETPAASPETPATPPDAPQSPEPQTPAAPPTEKPQAPTSQATPGATPEPAAQPRALPDTTLIRYFDRDVWRGYALQPAATSIHLPEAQREFATGTGVIAIIDSGIDVQHPALAGSFVPGFDFKTNQPNVSSDLASLAQSTAVILEAMGSSDPESLTVAQVNQSTAVILEQSTAVILEGQSIPEGFGHGTMVAGLVRLVAPTAKIMPLTAFSADGKGDLFDVVRAIYFAVDHGATVINMSFSLEQWSKELVRALNYAADHGVVCVASAGNGGQETMVFPSGFRGVISVGSTDSQDRRSLFSNYGKGLVRLFAPGEGLVTTFPGDHYALVSGTSFSTALVSGAASLLLDRNSDLDPEGVDLALARIRRPSSDPSATSPVITGAPQLRLDVFYALSRVNRGSTQK